MFTTTFLNTQGGQLIASEFLVGGDSEIYSGPLSGYGGVTALGKDLIVAQTKISSNSDTTE